MKVICEISRPHYHPGPEWGLLRVNLTKKRDLSQPGQWVANERLEAFGTSYAIVMPPRPKELYEDRQEPHFHCDWKTADALGLKHGQHIVRQTRKGHQVQLLIKVGDFRNRVHFDHVDAELYDIGREDTMEI